MMQTMRRSVLLMTTSSGDSALTHGTWTDITRQCGWRWAVEQFLVLLGYQREGAL